MSVLRFRPYSAARARDPFNAAEWYRKSAEKGVFSRSLNSGKFTPRAKASLRTMCKPMHGGASPPRRGMKTPRRTRASSNLKPSCGSSFSPAQVPSGTLSGHSNCPGFLMQRVWNLVRSRARRSTSVLQCSRLDGWPRQQ